jgi:hypothetical protein
MVTHLLAAVLASVLAGADSGTPASNNDALFEGAARNYRIQVYDTFRLDRAEYDRRRAEWTRIETAWQEAGRPEAEQPKLVHWLEEAVAQSRTESVGPLPAAPQIAVNLDAKKKDDDAWKAVVPTVVVPTNDAARVQPVSDPKSDAPEKEDAEKKPAASGGASSVEPSQDAAQQDPKQAATPVAATNTVEQAAPDVKPDVPAAPNQPAEQQRHLPNYAPWLHDLGEELGNDLNELAGAFVAKP